MELQALHARKASAIPSSHDGDEMASLIAQFTQKTALEPKNYESESAVMRKIVAQSQVIRMVGDIQREVQCKVD